MKYHITWNGEIIASFARSEHRNQLLIYWQDRFSYAADDIKAFDN